MNSFAYAEASQQKQYVPFKVFYLTNRLEGFSQTVLAVVAIPAIAASF